MKRFATYAALAFFIIFAVYSLLGGYPKIPAQHPDAAYHLDELAELPVQSSGRIKPLGTAARTILMKLSGKTANIKLADGTTLLPKQWIALMLFKPEAAADIPVFRIDHDEILAMLGRTQSGQKMFSYRELQPGFEPLAESARRALEKDRQLRTPFEQAVVKLAGGLTDYNKIITYEYPRIIPPANPAENPVWLTLPHHLAHVLSPAGHEGHLEGGKAPTMHPAAPLYTRLMETYRAEDPAGFNAELAKLEAVLKQTPPSSLGGVNSGHLHAENLLNRYAPFVRAMQLYVAAFIAILLAWWVRSKPLRLTAENLVWLAFIIHTLALVARMWVQGRPPVTNLYSSAIFVGWAAVLLGLFMERLTRMGLGTIVSASVGFCTLIVAHHLKLERGADTLEMMQAVLDSNFWLATHVVSITLGYSAMFLAGALGAVSLLGHFLARLITKKTNRQLLTMAYGAVCFGMLFSLVGTMLGGIWADQSWGRFWGWDPKENGALLIVLWAALALHARVGGFGTGRAFMALCVGGNIITSLSWFGTNMLGVGLHSYGFMDAAFIWLMLFILTQTTIVLLGYLREPVKH